MVGQRRWASSDCLPPDFKSSRGGPSPTGQRVVQLRTPAALKLALPMTLRERFYKGMKNGGQ